MPMTQIRHKALLSVFKTGKAKNVRGQALTWLRHVNYIDEADEITEKGKDYCLEYIPLTRQCELLGINFQSVQLHYTGRPENALLEHFEQQGYVGANAEGGFLVAVMKALTLNTLTKYNMFNSREDACLRYWHAQMIILREDQQEIYSWAPSTPEWPVLRKELLTEMMDCNRSTFLSHVLEIIATGDSRYQVPIDLAAAFYDLIETPVLLSLGTGFIDDLYDDYGWPDLTIKKGNEFRFIEIKTTDKLHASQISTLTSFNKLRSSLHAEVIKVVKLQQDK